MASQKEDVLAVLDDLLREEDILAAMVARRGFEGYIPASSKFKLKNIAVWNTLQNTMGDFFSIISKFSAQGLDKVYFELGDYEVVFFILHADMALVSVIPALANKGLLEVEMENSRREIKKILGVK
jgi:hypothetical protein